MMGMMVVHGAQAGGFSPISIYGTITNSVMAGRRPALQRDHHLPRQPGRQHRPGGDPVLRARWPQADEPAARPRRPGHAVRGPAPRRRLDPGAWAPAPRPRPRPRASASTGTRCSPWSRSSAVALIALAFDKNIGFVAITAAVAPGDALPERAQGRGQADRLADRAAGRRRQHLRHDPDHREGAGVRRRAGPPAWVPSPSARSILCYVGGVVSAFASSTALLPVIIPIAVPLIARRRHQRRLVRGRARGLLDHRRRQPVLHQRSPDAGQQAGHDRGAGLLQADPHLRRDRRPWSDRSSSGQPSCCRAGDGRDHRERAARRRAGRRPLPRARRTARHDDAGRPRRPGDQGRGARARRRHPRLGAAVRGPGGRPAVDVLPLGQPQQGVDHPRPQGRGRQARCCCSWSTVPTCWSRTSAPGCSSGSGSASRRCTSATRGWSCCR